MKIAWLTDWHGIFVDRYAWELALRITRDFEPTHVPIGSDDIDFYRISHYAKNPARREQIQDELDMQFKLYEELKDAADPHWRWLSRPDERPRVEHPTVLGNHNNRFFRTLWEDPKFFGLKDMAYPRLLKYDKYGFTWNGDEWDKSGNLEWVAGENLVFVHGNKVSQSPGYSVQGQMRSRSFDRSLVMGHCHRGAQTHIRRADGRIITGIEGFCLCQLDAEYAPSNNWTQGIVFITVTNDVPSFELIPFTRVGSDILAVWRGNEYRVTTRRVA